MDDLNSIVEKSIENRLDKLFGDKDDVLRTITRFSLLYSNPLENDDVKSTIDKMRDMNARMGELINDLQSTLDACGNIVVLDNIEDVSASGV